MKILSHTSNLKAQIISFPSKLLPSRWLRKMNVDQRRVFNLTVTAIVVVIGTWSISSLLAPDRSEASWFDKSWQYRQTVTATNESPYTATNIPYRVLMDTATPIAAGKMKSDGSDIRVVDNRGKVVRFQVEQSTLNTDETGIWFDANVQANASATYYVYYGNSSATTPSFNSDIASNVNNGTTITTKDGYEYTTTDYHAKVSTIKKDGTNLGVNGHQKNTDSFTGSWWSGATFTRTQLASGPMFVEIDFNDTNKDHYSSFGNVVKVFKNGFVDEQTYMHYNNTGSEDLYYYLSFTTGTRNSVWVDGSGTLIDQAANSGNLNRASLGDKWFGQRWTDTGNYGGTIISPTTSDWDHGGTSAQNSYYQTNYSTTESYATGSARFIRFGTFAGSGTVAQMHEKASLLGAQSTTIAAEETGPGPVAYWKFDEGAGTTIGDSSSNNNNGSLNGATWQSQDQCLTGKCLQFDGVNDYVSINDSNSLDLAQGWTIGGWIKPNETVLTGTNVQVLISKWQNSSSQLINYYLSIHTNGKIRALVGNGSESAKSATGTTILQPNQWYFVQATFDGSTGQLKVYVNGKLEGTTATGYTQAYTNSGNIRLGQFDFAWSAYRDEYKGIMDDMTIYPYARTQEQIYADYNHSAAAVLGARDANLSNGLLAYWKMDEASWNGTTGEVTDSTNHGYNLVASSAAITTGKFGNAGSFDGNDDYLEWANVPSSAKPNIRTKSYWIKPAALNSNRIYSTVAALSGDGLNPDSGYHYRTYSRVDTDGKITIGYSTYSCTGTASYLNYSYTSTDTISVNKWHHITEVVNYTNPTVKLYVDGKYQGESKQDGYTCTSNENNWWIGRRKMNNDFSGQIDEFRLYNRELTANEVTQLYHFAPPPVAYYDFEEGSGTSIYDRSGNNNNSSSFGGNPRWVQGKYGRGIDFDGIDDNIRITHNILSSSDNTISFWLKIPAQVSSYRRILSDATNGVEVHFTGNGTNGLYGSIGNSTGGWVMSSPNLTDDWHYVTLVSTASDGYTKAYLDGKLQSSTSKTYSSITLDDLYLGSTSNSSYFLDGTLDELRIYNYARNPGQIVEDMNAGHPIGGSPVGSQVGYWKFDEGTGTTVNNSGNGGSTYNGTITGATWSNSGKYNKALSFTGTNRVTIPDGSGALDFGTGDFTISAWIKTSTVANNGNLINKGAGNGLSGWRFGLANGIPTVLLGDSAGYSAGNVSTTSIADNTWHQVTIVYDRDTAAIGYVDGKRTGTRDISTRTGSVDNASSVNIGNTYDTFTGLIDNVKFYNTALTADEIKVDYNSSQSLQFGAVGTDASGNPSNSSDRAYCPPGDTTASCGPVGEWKFDERTGTTAKDTSGNGNNGTLTNGPTWTSGKVGAALHFDGANDFVDITDTANLQMTSNITVSLWVNPSILNNQVVNYPLSKGSGASAGNGWAFGISGTWATCPSNQFYVYTNNGQVCSGTGNTVPLNTWSHITFTNDGTTTYLYLNGRLVNSGSQTLQSSSGLNVNIARRSDGNWAFKGKVDQVQIYNYALSPAQIAWNYNKGAPIAHYKLNECQGSTVHSSTLPYNSALDGILTIGGTGTQTSAGTCQTAGTAWGNGANGKFDGSLNFDGTDDIVVTGDITDNITSYSVSLWFKPSGSGASTILQRGWSNSCRYEPQIAISNTTLTTKISGCSNAGLIGSTTVNTSIWNHVVVTVNGTSQFMYLNGSKIAETNKATAANANSKFFIGGTSADGTTPLPNFAGQIDDVQIFNYALTPQQVKAIMNQGAIYFGN